jgi:hypothetical protein
VDVSNSSSSYEKMTEEKDSEEGKHASRRLELKIFQLALAVAG